jgi:hypothetical protein
MSYALPMAGVEWWDAFWEMSADRLMPGGPIPSATLERWAARWAGEEHEFRECVRAMDVAAMKAARGERDPEPLQPGMLAEMTGRG